MGARDCREEGLAETGSQRTQSFHPETGIHLTEAISLRSCSCAIVARKGYASLRPLVAITFRLCESLGDWDVESSTSTMGAAPLLAPGFWLLTPVS